MLNFIVNGKSSSGNGLKVWMKIEKVLIEKKIEYKCHMTQRAGHATEIVRELCEKNEDTVNIVVVGGDGSINEVINGITDFEKVRFSVIPSGSGNDFARGMGIKKNTMKQLERIINSTEDYRIDLGQVKYNKERKSKYFAISSGVGMDALVCKKVDTSRLKKVLNKLHLGKLTYIIITVQSLFTMDYANTNTKFDGDREENFKNLIFMAFMNFEAEGGGVPMSPKADATDGKLSACACSNVSKWGALCRLPLLVMRNHENLKCFDMIECKESKLHLEKPMALHADGEYLGDVQDVEYKCLKGILRFMK